MARLIQAIRRYGPRLDHQSTIQLDEISTWMTRGTGISTGEIRLMFQELRDAILFYNRMGYPVKVEGVGIFSTSIGRDGSFKLHFRTDPTLKQDINNPHAYSGPIHNKGNIGLSDADYKALWDAEFPDDPLLLPGEDVA